MGLSISPVICKCQWTFHTDTQPYHVYLCCFCENTYSFLLKWKWKDWSLCNNLLLIYREKMWKWSIHDKKQKKPTSWWHFEPLIKLCLKLVLLLKCSVMWNNVFPLLINWFRSGILPFLSEANLTDNRQKEPRTEWRVHSGSWGRCKIWAWNIVLSLIFPQSFLIARWDHSWCTSRRELRGSGH